MADKLLLRLTWQNRQNVCVYFSMLAPFCYALSRSLPCSWSYCIKIMGLYAHQKQQHNTKFESNADVCGSDWAVLALFNYFSRLTIASCRTETFSCRLGLIQWVKPRWTVHWHWLVVGGACSELLQISNKPSRLNSFLWFNAVVVLELFQNVFHGSFSAIFSITFGMCEPSVRGWR